MIPLMLALACGGPASAPTPAAPPRVVTASYPADWLVARLAGELVTRERVVPTGEDPPDWQAPGEVVARAQTADLIVANGAGYEAWMANASLPEQKVVRTAAGLPLIVHQGQAHSHGDKPAHSHAGEDPHTWTDPTLFAKQAEAAHAALVKLLPDQRAHLDEQLAILQKDLQVTHSELEAATRPLKTRALAQNHPAFSYLAQTYGFELRTFDLDPQAAPSAETAAAVEAWAQGFEAPVLFWEAAPTPEVKAALYPRLVHVVLDPLEQPGADGAYDWLDQAMANGRALREAFPAPP